MRNMNYFYIIVFICYLLPTAWSRSYPLVWQTEKKLPDMMSNSFGFRNSSPKSMTVSAVQSEIFLEKLIPGYLVSSVNFAEGLRPDVLTAITRSGLMETDNQKHRIVARVRMIHRSKQSMINDGDQAKDSSPQSSPTSSVAASSAVSGSPGRLWSTEGESWQKDMVSQWTANAYRWMSKDSKRTAAPYNAVTVKASTAKDGPSATPISLQTNKWRYRPSGLVYAQPMAVEQTTNARSAKFFKYGHPKATTETVTPETTTSPPADAVVPETTTSPPADAVVPETTTSTPADAVPETTTSPPADAVPETTTSPPALVERSAKTRATRRSTTRTTVGVNVGGSRDVDKDVSSTTKTWMDHVTRYILPSRRKKQSTMRATEKRADDRQSDHVTKVNWLLFEPISDCGGFVGTAPPSPTVHSRAD